MTGHPPHNESCYGREQHPCPKCGQWLVTQVRLQCGTPDTTPPMECVECELACKDCPSEVRITEGARLLRARVIHAATCPWFRRHQAREPGYTGAIPCGTVVTHRGPYKRDPRRAA